MTKVLNRLNIPEESAAEVRARKNKRRSAPPMAFQSPIVAASIMDDDSPALSGLTPARSHEDLTSRERHSSLETDIWWQWSILANLPHSSWLDILIRCLRSGFESFAACLCSLCILNAFVSVSLGFIQPFCLVFFLCKYVLRSWNLITFHSASLLSIGLFKEGTAALLCSVKLQCDSSQTTLGRYRLRPLLSTVFNALQRFLTKPSNLRSSQINNYQVLLEIVWKSSSSWLTELKCIYSW